MFVAYTWQLWKIWNGASKPHPIAWIGFGLLTGIGYLVQYQEGAGAGSWVMGLTAIFCFLIAGMSQYKVRWQKSDFNNWDWAALILGIGLFVLYLISKRLAWGPTLSAILATLADLVFYIPIFRKAWMLPYDEFAPAYTLNSLKFVPSMFAMSAYSTATCLYPFAMIFANAIVVFYLLWRRKCLTREPPETATETLQKSSTPPNIVKVIIEWILLFLLVMVFARLFCNELKGIVSENHETEVLFAIYAAIIPFFIASVFSVKSLWDSREQGKNIEHQQERLKEITERLEYVAKTLPTRFIGSFPDHLNVISELIQRANENFYILVDCADYGSFSYPEGHKAFMEAIRSVRNRANGEKEIAIEIKICGKFELISRSSEFWQDWEAARSKKNPNAWEKLQCNPKFRNCINKFCRSNEIAKTTFDPDNYTKNDFIRLLRDKHKTVVKELRELKVQVGHCRGLQHRMAGIFFWMRDEAEAIFLLSHTGTEAHGLAFVTSDKNLMEVFIDTWKEHLTSPKTRLRGTW